MAVNVTYNAKNGSSKPKAKPKGKSRSSKPENFDRRVKKVLMNEMETKKITVFLGGATDTVPINIQASGLKDTGFGTHIGNVWNNNNMTIAQGIKQNERIGREINNCSLWLKGCITAAFHNESTNTNQFPFDVYLIVYKDKLSPNTNVPDDLKMTGSTSTHISGTPMNFMLPFNKDRYIIYTNRRIARFKPMPQDRPEVVDSVLQNPTIGNTGNCAYKYFSYKLPCPKTLTFKSNASQLVTNAHLGIGFYVINGSGAPPRS
jgi:hypothetical protein